MADLPPRLQTALEAVAQALLKGQQFIPASPETMATAQFAEALQTPAGAYRIAWHLLSGTASRKDPDSLFIFPASRAILEHEKASDPDADTDLYGDAAVDRLARAVLLEVRHLWTELEKEARGIPEDGRPTRALDSECGPVLWASETFCRMLAGFPSGSFTASQVRQEEANAMAGKVQQNLHGTTPVHPAWELFVFDTHGGPRYLRKLAYVVWLDKVRDPLATWLKERRARELREHPGYVLPLFDSIGMGRWGGAHADEEHLVLVDRDGVTLATGDQDLVRAVPCTDLVPRRRDHDWFNFGYARTILIRASTTENSHLMVAPSSFRLVSHAAT